MIRAPGGLEGETERAPVSSILQALGIFFGPRKLGQKRVTYIQEETT